jgi:hypothetical protein
LAAETAGITYKTHNEWMKKGHTEKFGKYYHIFKCIQKCNADDAKKLLKRLNGVAKASDTQHRVYWKTNAVSKNKNENIGITVTEVDILRKQI